MDLHYFKHWITSFTKIGVLVCLGFTTSVATAQHPGEAYYSYQGTTKPRLSLSHHPCGDARRIMWKHAQSVCDAERYDWCFAIQDNARAIQTSCELKFKHGKACPSGTVDYESYANEVTGQKSWKVKCSD